MYKAHPVADAWPLMKDKDFAALVEDIKQHGLIHPIHLIGDLIIDGRDRQRACLAAGVEARYLQIETDDPVTHAASCNEHRKHLTTRQRSAVAAELAKLKVGDVQAQKDGGSNDPPLSTQDAADLMGVSRKSVTRAKKVMKEDPEAHQAAKEGRKVKKPKVANQHKRVSWTKLAEETRFLSSCAGGTQRVKAKAELKALDNSIEFTRGGLLPEMAGKVRAACIEIVRRRDPKRAEQEAQEEADVLSTGVSVSGKKRIEAAIRAHKRVLEASEEWRLQVRVQEELQRILPEYNLRHEQHLDVMNAYRGPLDHAEYKLITGLLHSDRLPMIDEVHRKRFDKAFDIMTQKRALLCGLRDNGKIESTLPQSVEEMLKRKK